MKILIELQQHSLGNPQPMTGSLAKLALALAECIDDEEDWEVQQNDDGDVRLIKKSVTTH